MAQVFLSYSRRDQDAATRVRDYLTGQGVQVWQDTHGIRGGELVDDRIKQAIQAAGFLVVIVSASSAASQYVAWEVRYALELRLRGAHVIVVPVRIDHSELPDYLKHSLALRLQAFDDEELHLVFTAIHAEHVQVLLEDEAMRITVLRRGAPFDQKTNHPVQAQVFVSCDVLFVVMVQSVGPPVLAAEATRLLGSAAQHFFRNVGALDKIEGELHPEAFFRRFFELLNGAYKRLLAEIEAPDAVMSDLTLAMFAGGDVYMRNAGASCGIVRRFVGMRNETDEVWTVQMMTGNVAGEIAMQDCYGATNVFAYPIGRFSRITDATPLIHAFDTPRSVVALANFKLAQDSVHALTEDTIGLDALGMARRLIEMRMARQAASAASGADSLVVTIECLAPPETFLSDAQVRALRQAGSPGVERGTSVAVDSSEDLMVRGQNTLEAGDLGAATAAFEAARDLCERAGDVPGVARAIMSLGAAEARRDQHEAAATRFEDALAIATRIKDLAMQAQCLTSLGAITRRRGDAELALGYYARALPLANAMRNDYAKGMLLNNIGMVHSTAGDHGHALQCFRDAMRALDADSCLPAHVSARSNAAWELHYHLGRSAEAGELWQQVLTTMRKHRLPFTANGVALIQIQTWYEETAGVVRSQDEYEQVVREAGDFVAADPGGAQAVLQRTAGRLLTGLAEALLEQTLFGPDHAEYDERFEAAIAWLRRAREDGIKATYRGS